MPTAQPAVRDAWIDLVYERLSVNNIQHRACWHRASGWWSLQIDHEEPYVLYVCDDGRLHVNSRGSKYAVRVLHPDIVADVVSATLLADGETYRCVVALHPDAVAHANAAAFIDALLPPTPPST